MFKKNHKNINFLNNFGMYVKVLKIILFWIFSMFVFQKILNIFFSLLFFIYSRKKDYFNLSLDFKILLFSLRCSSTFSDTLGFSKSLWIVRMQTIAIDCRSKYLLLRTTVSTLKKLSRKRLKHFIICTAILRRENVVFMETDFYLRGKKERIMLEHGFV